jgi:Cdc6-like AAA superfamily ATPase
MGANPALCLSCAHYISNEWATENQENLINQNKAQIVINALQQGIPPQFGILQLVFGRDEQKKIVEQHLEMVSNGNSRFLVVSGAYGTGKTHLLQFILERSLLDDFVASKIALKTECSFKEQITVYSELMRFLVIPDKRGEDAIDWIARRVGRKQLPRCVPENIALAFEKATDQMDHRRIFLDYISGRSVPVNQLRSLSSIPRIKMKLEDEDFMDLINGMAAICNQIEYSGMVLLFDEVENLISSSLTPQQSERAISNLVILLNNIDYFENVYFVFAVTSDLFEILKARGAKFDNSNSSKLSPLKSEELILLGKEIRKIHALAFDWQPEAVITDSVIKEVCAHVTSHGGNIREFVKSITQRLNAAQGS